MASHSGRAGCSRDEGYPNCAGRADCNGRAGISPWGKVIGIMPTTPDARDALMVGVLPVMGDVPKKQAVPMVRVQPVIMIVVVMQGRVV